MGSFIFNANNSDTNLSFNDTVQLSHKETQTGTTNGGALSLRCGNFTVNHSEFNNNYVVGAENTTVYASMGHNVYFYIHNEDLMQSNTDGIVIYIDDADLHKMTMQNINISNFVGDETVVDGGALIHITKGLDH